MWVQVHLLFAQHWKMLCTKRKIEPIVANTAKHVSTAHLQITVIAKADYD